MKRPTESIIYRITISHHAWQPLVRDMDNPFTK